MFRIVLYVEPKAGRIIEPEGTMADKDGDPGERVRQHVRRVLEQLAARERNKRVTRELAPALKAISGKVEREQNRPTLIGNG